mmetsp:Transcript_32232/g.48314  ORF Transcript_32232/g.48314 Transcript_32232/m.48314 type:complete len:325 (-) Transcript_32232:160-1134(-)
MNQLPSKLLQIFRLLLIRGKTVVSSKITSEITHQNRTNHGRKNHHNHQTIQNGKPMHLGRNGIIHTQINIPTRRPMQIRILVPNHIIRKKHTTTRRLRLTSTSIHHFIPRMLLGTHTRITRFNWIGNIRHLKSLHSPLLGIIIIGTRLKVMLNTKRFHCKPHNPSLIRLSLHTMILNLNIHMIMNIRPLRILGNKPNREPLPIPRSHSRIILHLTRRGNIIHNPIIMIILANGPDHFIGRDALLLPPAQVGDAELFAVHVDFHVDAVGGGFDAVSGEEFSEVFVVHFGAAFGLAEGEAVVVYWEECFLGGHFVYFEFHGFSFTK